MIPNVSAILTDFQTIGEGLVKRIEVMSAWQGRLPVWHLFYAFVDNNKPEVNFISTAVLNIMISDLK